MIESPFDEGHVVVPVYQQNGGGAGTILSTFDEDRRKQAFTLRADSGVGQQVVFKRRMIGQCRKNLFRVYLCLPGNGFQPGLDYRHLGPVGVEQMIGKSMDAVCDRAGRSAPVGEIT